MKSAAVSGADVDFVEIPLTPDAALVIRSEARFRILTYFLQLGLVAALVLIGAGLTVGLSPGGLWLAIPLGVLVAALSTVVWRTWSGARGDIARRTTIRATGRMSVWAKTYYDQPDIDFGFGRTCVLVIQGVRLKLEDAAAASIWSHPAATKVKHSDGLISAKESWAFKGVVEYAPRSSIVLKISTGDGLLVWQDPRLAPGARPRSWIDITSRDITSPASEPDIVGELEHRFLPILEAGAEGLRAEFERHDIRTSSHAVASLRGHAIAIDCLVPDLESVDRPTGLRLEISARHVDTKPLLDNAMVCWNPPSGYLEIDLVPMPEPASARRLDELETQVPQLVVALRDALRRGSPPR